MEERRQANRQLTCIPAHVEAKDESPHLALINDVSVTGARLLTRAKLELDEELTLTLYLSPDQTAPRSTSGKVVRAARRALDRSDVWQWEIGVEFHKSIDEFKDEIEDLCERQRRVGVLKE